VPNVEPPEPTRLGEVVWLQPFPDALLDGATDVPLGPEARYEQTESISLAFVTALQVLPPRQLAVLILRDVIGFHANEVADMVDSTVDSVNSALNRARASLQRRRAATADREPPPACDSPSEDAIVAKFVNAWESADLDALVALLTDDVSSRRRCRSSMRAETSWPVSARVCSARAGGSTSCAREPTVSRLSGPTCAPAAGSATGSACMSSASPATGFAP
jgi:hypothetical protein